AGPLDRSAVCTLRRAARRRGSTQMFCSPNEVRPGQKRRPRSRAGNGAVSPRTWWLLDGGGAPVVVVLAQVQRGALLPAGARGLERHRGRRTGDAGVAFHAPGDAVRERVVVGLVLVLRVARHGLDGVGALVVQAVDHGLSNLLDPVHVRGRSAVRALLRLVTAGQGRLGRRRGRLALGLLRLFLLLAGLGLVAGVLGVVAVEEAGCDEAGEQHGARDQHDDAGDDACDQAGLLLLGWLTARIAAAATGIAAVLAVRTALPVAGLAVLLAVLLSRLSVRPPRLRGEPTAVRLLTVRAGLLWWVRHGAPICSSRNPSGNPRNRCCQPPPSKRYRMLSGRCPDEV